VANKPETDLYDQSQLADAVRSTPITVPLLCAIACREAGMYWLPLTPHKSAAEILGLAVYDASGDVSGAPRNVFPVNTAEFRLAYGNEFTSLLIDETNKARAARGLAPLRRGAKGLQPCLGEASHFCKALEVAAAGFDQHHLAQRIDQRRLRRLRGGLEFFVGRGKRRCRAGQAQRKGENGA